MQVVIIGSGNVATVLGRKIVAARHKVIQVFSRNPLHASVLASDLKCSFTSNPAELDTTGNLYLLTISDDALYHLNNWLHLENRLVVHTAGSVSINVLQKISSRFGVLYPLQSLRKELTTIPEIPFLIDGNEEESVTEVKNFARTLSPQVVSAGDEMREKLHLAAVITNNFTNHLYAMAQDFCTREQVSFNLLLPLISEMNRRVALGPVAAFQTGPASRNDRYTMDHHRLLLNKYPRLQQLYNTFSESISEKHPS